MDHARTSTFPLRHGRNVHRPAPVAIALVQQGGTLQQLVTWCARRVQAIITSIQQR